MGISAVSVATALSITLVSACGGAAADGQGPRPPSAVDPKTCGNYAVDEAGVALEGFLDATVALDRAVRDTEREILAGCRDIGRELGVDPATLARPGLKPVCGAAAAALKDHLATSVRANASLDLEVRPAVCTIDADAEASAEAHCTTGALATACKSDAAVRASLSAACTPPELDVRFDADIAVDPAKLERTVAAIEAGVPRLMALGARIEGPLRHAFVAWAKSVKALYDAGDALFASAGEQADCLVGQVAGAFALVVEIEVSIEVQLEVTASVSGAAGVAM